MKTLKANQKFKDTPAGRIPVDWAFLRLKDVAQLQTGLSLSSGRKLENPVERPYLRVANVQDGHLDLSDVKTTRIEEGNIERYLLKEGDVLFTEGGDFDKLGRGTVWEGQIDGCLHQNHIFAVRPDEGKIHPYFLAALSSGPAGRRYFTINSKQSTNLASINSTQLKAFPVPLPPTVEQDEIVRLLGVWDQAIRLQEELLRVKEERKRGLMQQLLTGKRRLPGFGGAKRMNHRFYDLPEGWGNPMMGEIAKERSVRNKQEEELKVLSCTKYKGFVDSEEYFGRKVHSEDLTNYKVVRRNWFGFPSNHVEEGSIGLQTVYKAGLVSPIYVVFETGQSVLPTFLMYLFKTDLYRHIFQSSTNASVDRRGSLRWRDFSKIHVPLPPIDEQKAIVEVVKIADREIECEQEHLNELKTQKKGLMQKLLTGRVRVGT